MLDCTHHSMWACHMISAAMCAHTHWHMCTYRFISGGLGPSTVHNLFNMWVCISSYMPWWNICGPSSGVGVHEHYCFVYREGRDWSKDGVFVPWGRMRDLGMHEDSRACKSSV
jgi:hypothetical protein